MREITKKYPKLRGYVQHGALPEKIQGDEAICACPFCDKRKHLYINHTNGLWSCKHCGREGNFSGFLQQIAELWRGRTSNKQLQELARERGILPKTLKRWGVCYNGLLYLIPGYHSGNITDLRMYQPHKKTRNTAGTKSALLGSQHINSSGPIWVCEGEWDAMAMDEILQRTGTAGCAVGVPGASVFKTEWLTLFKDREANLVYDHDAAGARGEARAYNLLNGVARKVQAVHWPATRPDGYDLRDLYNDAPNPRTAYKRVIRLLKEQPREPISGPVEADNAATQSVYVGEGLSRTDTVAEYRKWLHLPDDYAIDVMFGTVFANRLEGDPLWMFLVAPPGGCKTELLMSLNTAPNITSMTSLTPHTLVSGASYAGGGDPSLLPLLDGKVVVIKDFTTILNMHPTARDEIFGVLRDAYDGSHTKRFGTGVWRTHKSRFGMLAGVTPAIQMFGSMHSTLGERFLRYRLPQSTGTASIKRAIQNIDRETTMRDTLQETGKAVLDYDVSPLPLPGIPDDILDKVIGLAQWIALLRGVVVRERYTGEVYYKPVPEVGTRLAKQIAKLLLGVCLFRRVGAVTPTIYRIAAHVARDTVPDRVEALVRSIYVHKKNDYVSTNDVSGWTRLPASTCNKLIQDLVLLKTVVPSKRTRGQWRLSARLCDLMNNLELYPEDKICPTRKRRKRHR